MANAAMRMYPPPHRRAPSGAAPWPRVTETGNESRQTHATLSRVAADSTLPLSNAPHARKNAGVTCCCESSAFAVADVPASWQRNDQLFRRAVLRVFTVQRRKTGLIRGPFRRLIRLYVLHKYPENL